MYASFDRFELKLTKAQAETGSHSGDCESDVRALLAVPAIARQFKRIDPDAIRAELKGHGAWDAEELADDEMNQVRILWIACGDIRDERCR